MSELAHFQQQPTGQLAPVAPAPADNRRVVSLVEWGQAAKAAHEVAIVLVQTPFVPTAYRDNPYAATAAILAGDEVGLNPMAALSAFDVIEGRAAARAITLRAIVQSKGHDIWVQESTDQRCVVRGRRAGSQLVQESVWTIQRARTMKLTGRRQWETQPQAMLVARATAECCRMVAADAILGIPHSVEELADEQPEPAPAAGQLEPARTAQRKPRTSAPKTAPAAPRAAGARPAGTATPAGRPAAAAPTPSPQGPPLPGETGYGHDEPDVIDEADYQQGKDQQPADVQATGQHMSGPQQRKLFALLREAEIDSKEERFAWASGLLGRDISSYGQLSVADAVKLIDALESPELAAAEQDAADDDAQAEA